MQRGVLLLGGGALLLRGGRALLHVAQLGAQAVAVLRDRGELRFGTVGLVDLQNRDADGDNGDGTGDEVGGVHEKSRGSGGRARGDGDAGDGGGEAGGRRDHRLIRQRGGKRGGG